jgi:hypothetical protein
VTTGSVWKYLDNGSNQGTNWTSLTFNDASWASGPAELGFGDTAEGRPEATVVSFGPVATNKYVTTYFRRAFQISNPASVTSLAIRLLRDDGAVVYLNGTEVFRSNMPEDVINYLTFASAVVGNADEFAFYSQTVAPSLLVNGTNVLAVEIHQNVRTSSDLSFDLELSGLAYPPNQGPSVNAGTDQTLTLPATALLGGIVTDDGLPIPPGLFTIAWSKVSGPGTVTFANANSANTTASFSTGGTYVLRLTAHDGAVPASDDVTVMVNGGGQPELRVESIQVTTTTPPVLRIGFTAVAGQAYTVQYRDSLTGGNWSKLTDVPVPGSTQTVEVTDTGMSASTTRYYRIVTPQQP